MLEFLKFLGAVVASTLVVSLSMAGMIALLRGRAAKSEHSIEKPGEPPKAYDDRGAIA